MCPHGNVPLAAAPAAPSAAAAHHHGVDGVVGGGVEAGRAATAVQGEGPAAVRLVVH